MSQVTYQMQYALPKVMLRESREARFYMELTYQAVLFLRSCGWKIYRRSDTTHRALKSHARYDCLDDRELRWLAKQQGWSAPKAEPDLLKVRVNYPGHWAHGRLFTAYQHDAKLRNRSTIRCWMIQDKERGECGIPLTCAAPTDQEALTHV